MSGPQGPITAPEPTALVATEPATPTAPVTTPAGGPDAPTEGDPFPREAWTTLASHAAGYLRLTLALLRDPAVSRHRRAALLAAAAYFASPIDLIPGIVPVLGQVDDLAVAMLAIRLALNALEPSRRQAHLAAAGLSDETLHQDLVAAGRLGAWAARAGARTGMRVGRGAIRVTARAGRAAANAVIRGGRATAHRAAPMRDQASSAAGQAVNAAGRVTDAGRSGATATAGRVTDAAGRVTDAAGRVTDAAGRAASTGRAMADRIRRRRPSVGTPADDQAAPERPTDEPSDLHD